MQSRTAIVSGLVLGVVLFSFSVQAQEDSALEPFNVSLTLRGDYIDNIDSQPSGMEEDTFDFYIKPRLDWSMDGERSFLNLFYAPSWRYRTDESPTQNSEEWQHDLGLRTEYNTSPGTVLRLDEKFDYTDDSSVTTDSGTVRADASYLLNRVEVGATREFSEAWTGDLAARHMTKQYDEDAVAASSDEDRIDGEGSATYQISPTLGSHLTVRYSDYSFDNTGGLERDFSSLLVAVGLKQVVNPQLSGSISAGVQSQDYDDSAIDVDETPFANLTLMVSSIPATRLRASVEHGLRDSDVYPFASQEYTDLKASIAWDVLPRVTLSVLGLYRNSDYDDAAPGSAAATDYVKASSGEEDKYIAEGEIAYQFNKRNRISLSQRYEDVESDVSTDYTKNTTRVLYGRAF